MPFKYDADGGLTLYFQNESPGKDREAMAAPRSTAARTGRGRTRKPARWTDRVTCVAAHQEPAFKGLMGSALLRQHRLHALQR